MKKILASVILFASFSTLASTPCHSAIDSAVAVSKSLGIIETSLINARSSVQLLKFQKNTFKKSPDLEYSLGSTEAEVDIEHTSEVVRVEALEREKAETELDLEEAMALAKKQCK